jgi:hypothetical protein
MRSWRGDVAFGRLNIRVMQETYHTNACEPERLVRERKLIDPENHPLI